ncbi:hypothetical protein NKI38_09040 [Mesorhizobium sp. M0621]|uniref:hypothetical protein n=1 Tax=Mesorhizobium sp. M0621 TaxID=2956974 RepID=UPI0033351CC4
MKEMPGEDQKGRKAPNMIQRWIMLSGGGSHSWPTRTVSCAGVQVIVGTETIFNSLNFSLLQPPKSELCFRKVL